MITLNDRYSCSDVEIWLLVVGSFSEECISFVAMTRAVLPLKTTLAFGWQEWSKYDADK